MTKVTINKQRKQLATVEEFERWLSKKKTDHNYEFVNGQAIKKNPMKQSELLMVQFLTRLFSKTLAYENYGELVPEADTYIDEYRKRVPDLAYFTAEQIKQAAIGVKVVPAFVIELVSDSESFDDVEKKIKDYYDAGVQVVWYINPKSKRIHNYISPKNVIICADNDVCSAEPALLDFKFEVRELFEV